MLFGPPRVGVVDADGFVVGRSVKTRSGQWVSEDAALNYSAAWCATRVISEAVGSLPLLTYRRMPDNGRELATDHPLYELLKFSPNESMGSTVFREGRTMHQVNYGNGFAEIEVERRQIVALHPIHPSRVHAPTKSERAQGWAYSVRNNDNSQVLMRRDEMLHVPGVLSEDGVWGKGVIQYARESLGFANAVEQHGADYFGSGAQPKGILTAPGMKDPEQRRNMRKEWKEVHGSNNGEIAIFPPESKYSPITIGNEDSQFLETRKHNINEFARWYRVPAHMLGDLERATFSNIEQQSIDFIAYSLLPWLRKWEEELMRKLLSEAEREEYFIEFNLAGLLRGDISSRMTAYQLALQNGIMTINEVRRLENLPGIGPAGDVNYVQLNMSTAQRIMDGTEQRSGATERPAKQEALPLIAPIADALGAPHGKEALRNVLVDAVARVLSKEANAAQRAISGSQFLDWLDSFYAKHQATAYETLRPALAMMNAMGMARDLTATTKALCDESKALLRSAAKNMTTEQSIAMLKSWPTQRAAQVADELLKETSNVAA